MKKFLTVVVSAASLFAFSASAASIIYSGNPMSPLIVTSLNGTQIRQQQAPVVLASAPAPDASSADAMANLAPAAGGPRALSDRFLASDSSIGLRNDSTMIQ